MTWYISPERSAALIVRRQRVVYLYVEERKTITDIARQIGIGNERVRQDLIRMGVARRCQRTSTERTAGYVPAYRRPRNPRSEHSKSGGAVTEVRDASKIPRLSANAEALLFAGRAFDDHPNPVAGQPVSINPRAVYGSYDASGIGCAAAMCEDVGGVTIWGGKR